MLPAVCESGARSLEYEQIALSSTVVAVRSGDSLLDEAALAALAVVPRYARPHAVLDSLCADACAAAFGEGVRWSCDPVLALEPAYFSAPVPFARHQTLLTAGSLINVQVLSTEHLESMLRWIRSQPPFWRMKGTLYLEQGRRVILDRAHEGPLLVLDGRPWKNTEEVPANKLVFIGREVDATLLKTLLCVATGLDMQPTVLYSAPPPVVDTPSQRVALLLLLIVAVGSSWSFQWASIFAVLVYFLLSIKK
jgi:hypothetical protein